MTYMNQQTQGAWVFLSHSHRDIDQVREIRNELERRGHNPLMFYLKCLDDDDSQLPDLLRKEIAARDWFILCDSPNSRASGYVQDEIEMIKGLEGKVFEAVDLSQDLQSELHKLIALSRRATVFLSHASADSAVAEQIGSTFRAHDYRVFLPQQDIAPGSDFRSAIAKAIDEAAKEGFFLILLSKASLQSQFVLAELMHAREKTETVGACSNIIPLFLDPMDDIIRAMPPAMQLTLGAIQGIDMSAGDLTEKTEQLIKELKTRQME
ncbi:MAG: toll/interleukin-1 receptor domain-containing protein [Kiritimatiellae bacterium]|nr:toll/interleukin-1 receptor domain-containing protein [Kiritimatiellia bacterium]